MRVKITSQNSGFYGQSGTVVRDHDFGLSVHMDLEKQPDYNLYFSKSEVVELVGNNNLPMNLTIEPIRECSGGFCAHKCMQYSTHLITFHWNQYNASARYACEKHVHQVAGKLVAENIRPFVRNKRLSALVSHA